MAGRLKIWNAGTSSWDYVAGGDIASPVASGVAGVGGVASFALSVPAGLTGVNHLRVTHSLRTNYASATFDLLALRFNGDGASNYQSEEFAGDNATVSAATNSSNNIRAAYTTAALAAAGLFGSGTIDIPYYAATDRFKNCICDDALRESATVLSTNRNVGFWQSNAAITVVNFLPNNGSLWAEGSRCDLYVW